MTTRAGAQEQIRALATVTLDAQALDELGPRTIDRLADLVAQRLAERRAAGEAPLLTTRRRGARSRVCTRRRCGGRSRPARSTVVGLRRAAAAAAARGRRSVDRGQRAARSRRRAGRAAVRPTARSARGRAIRACSGTRCRRSGVRSRAVSVHRDRARRRLGRRGGCAGATAAAARRRGRGRSRARRDAQRVRGRAAPSAAARRARAADRLAGDARRVRDARRGRRRTRSTLAPATAKVYASLYDKHIAPHLGHLKLIEITPEAIARWQAERIAAGAGASRCFKALTVLGLDPAAGAESERIARNPARLVRKVRRPAKAEVRPLAPATVEAMRAASNQRDATLISVLAYAGLRPQEALGLRWRDVGERTLLINAPKTGQRRNVRLLAPLREDLDAWRQDQDRRTRSSSRATTASAGRLDAYKSWARKAAARTQAQGQGRADRQPGSVRPGGDQGGRPGRDAVHAAALVLLAAAARGPLGDLRRAPARARRRAYAVHVRARDRRARRGAPNRR